MNKYDEFKVMFPYLSKYIVSDIHEFEQIDKKIPTSYLADFEETLLLYYKTNDIQVDEETNELYSVEGNLFYSSIISLAEGEISFDEWIENYSSFLEDTKNITKDEFRTYEKYKPQIDKLYDYYFEKSPYVDGGAPQTKQERENWIISDIKNNFLVKDKGEIVLYSNPKEGKFKAEELLKVNLNTNKLTIDGETETEINERKTTKINSMFSTICFYERNKNYDEFFKCMDKDTIDNNFIGLYNYDKPDHEVLLFNQNVIGKKEDLAIYFKSLQNDEMERLKTLQKEQISIKSNVSSIEKQMRTYNSDMEKKTKLHINKYDEIINDLNLILNPYEVTSIVTLTAPEDSITPIYYIETKDEIESFLKDKLDTLNEHFKEKEKEREESL